MKAPHTKKDSKAKTLVGGSSVSTASEQQLIDRSELDPILTTDMSNLVSSPQTVEAREKIVSVRFKPSVYKRLRAFRKKMEKNHSKTLETDVTFSDSKIISDIVENLLLRENL